MPKKTYEHFEDAFVKSLNDVSSVKQRTLRANEKPQITKEMRQAIMLRSQLQTRKFKTGTAEDIAAFNRQRNFCNRLAKRTRKKHYNNLDIKDITDNKKFWNTVLPFFSDKSCVREKIMLRENDKIISDSAEVAEIFANYFQKSGSMESLGITENKLLLTPVTDEIVLDVEKCIKKFESHPSIISINKNVVVNDVFNFSPITAEDIDEQINALDPKKNGGCIPTKLIKEMRHIVRQPLADIWNIELLKEKTFSGKLKLGDISALFKALEKTNKTNYRPITVLVVVSKIFEKIMDKQTNTYIEKFLSKWLCGYRTNFNCEVALVPMIEKWKMARDKGDNAGGVLMDLSKAFDTINHELLIAKLHAYGFSIDALKIVHSYLSDRWIRTKIDGSYSTWKQILSGMPQGSVNGPKWFNIYLNDLFFLFINTEVCNIADDSTPYACNANLSILLQHLESDVASAIMWFDANYMKLNQSKCHFLISTNSPEHLWIQVGEQIIWESLYKKLLGITISKDLKFNLHVQDISKKAGAKVTALARMFMIMTMEQKKTIMNAFIESQFSHCPLVWMFCPSRKLNNRINHIHERGLRIVYNDYSSSFSDLLIKNGSVTIHHRNIQLVAIQMFKVKHDMCPKIMKDLFNLNTNPKVSKTFFIPHVQTEFMGKQSLSYFGPVVWEIMLPNELKNITNFEKFKDSIKKWVPDCKCRLCKPFVADVGFI
jgi:DNA polymerase III epsilon subunit-like protein